jgi:hypothetical protein
VAKEPKNHGKPWSPADVRQLKQEVKHNTPTRVLGIHLGRTPQAVQAKATELKVSLKPTNQSPYGTQK